MAQHLLPCHLLGDEKIEGLGKRPLDKSTRPAEIAVALRNYRVSAVSLCHGHRRAA